MGATSSGNAPSAAFGGIIGQFVSWRALFLLYGLGALLIAAMLFRVSVDQGESAGPAPTARADRRYGEVLHLRQARLLFLFVGLEGVFSYGGFTYLGAYLNARFGIDYLTIGIILASYGTGTVLTSRFASRALKRLGEANLILISGVGLLRVTAVARRSW